MSWLLVVVALSTWPTHASGRFVRYGSQRLVQANADWHGYTLTPYREHCGVSALSPADLGKIVWLRTNTHPEWYGPCLTVDVAARHDFAWIVYYAEEVAELADPQLQHLGLDKTGWGEVYVGRCPPEGGSVARPYQPPLVVDERRPIIAYSNYPYPTQQWPVDCSPEYFLGTYRVE